MTATVGCRWEPGQRPLLCGGTASALPSPVDETDWRSRFDWVEDQDVSEGCVGEALEAGQWLGVGGQGRRASPRGFWRHARFREKARRGDAIANTGCNPYDAIDAAIAIGIYARDERDDDQAAWNSGETLLEAEGSRLFLPEHFLFIEPGDVDTVDRVLTAGKGVLIFGDIDGAYQALAAGQVWPGMTGPSQGGHARLLQGHSKPRGFYWEKGSWSPRFADNGNDMIARAYVASGVCGLVGVLGGPVL